MERRTKERYRIWFPMSVVTADGEEGTAISYDVSTTGLLMACPGRLDIGSIVTLRFRVAGEDPERRVPCEVVRVEERPDADGPWRFRMAVEFDEAQPDLEARLIENRENG